jgi:DNA-directed DNA polymerase III PolC
MYVELHARSAFSFLEGASLPEMLMARCAELQMPAMALLDRNGLYGAPRFHITAEKAGTRAHIGAEIAVRDAGERVCPPEWVPHRVPVEPVRFPVLVESALGYQNLCRLITRYKLREGTKAEGAATLADIEEHAEGLICLTGGDEGPLASALSRGGFDEGLREVERLVNLFGSRNVYVELQRHCDRNEEYRNQAAVRTARRMRLPVLATNGVSHARPRDREVMDVLTTIRHHCTLDTAGHLLALNSERYLRSPLEMQELFHDLPEAIGNTIELSARLSYEMRDLGYRFPSYPVPDGETMQSFLEKRTGEGVRDRYLPKRDAKLFEKAKQQAQHELALIGQLELAGYFLIVWDIVQFCRREGILVQGRGSAANSVVCYALGLTAIDPVGMELLFERFLSAERGEWPDIDLDLPSDKHRERVIQYVYQLYGELGAAMTANVITYRGKSTAREVEKVLGFDAKTLNRLTKLVGAREWKGPTDTLHHSFRNAGLDLHHRRIATYLDICERMQDLPRHLGQHSGGMVICAGQLNAVVPLERASMPGRTVIQWDKEDCADLKIIKVDLLGLGMMAVLEDCLELVPRHYKEPLDLAQLPQDDPKVYEVLQRPDTVGMFQVESRAQMSALPRNRPECFYDIVVQVAIIRPGPIVGKMVNPYMKRRLGKEKVTYDHPLLEPVLKRTLGVPLCQEQLIRMSMIVANFSGGEAEELRRAIGMRRSQARMQAMFLAKDINANDGSTDGQNCSMTPNTCTGSCTEPAWEWQWNANPLCDNSPNALVKNPSLDDKAREFDWCWGGGSGCSCTSCSSGYGGALFHSDLNTSSNPDTSDTEFTWSGWYYYTDFDDIDNVELDMNQVLSDPGQKNNTATVIFAAQCDLTKTSPLWEFVNHWQIDSNITCPRSQWTNNAWHHIVIYASRTSSCSVEVNGIGGCSLTYYSVTFDGNTQKCTGTCTSASNAGAYGLGWQPVGLLLQNVQFGVTNSASGANTAYADLMTVHSGPPTTVATPTIVPCCVTSWTPPGEPIVTISTSTSGATICYTTDGSTPTTNGGGECTGESIQYNGPFPVTGTETVNAIGTEDGIDFDSAVATAIFTED